MNTELTKEEHNELINISEQFASLYLELGQVEIEILELSKHKNELLKKHDSLKDNEKTTWDSLTKKYGEIESLDIEKGNINIK